MSRHVQVFICFYGLHCLWFLSVHAVNLRLFMWDIILKNILDINLWYVFLKASVTLVVSKWQLSWKVGLLKRLSVFYRLRQKHGKMFHKLTGNSSSSSSNDSDRDTSHNKHGVTSTQTNWQKGKNTEVKYTGGAIKARWDTGRRHAELQNKAPTKQTQTKDLKTPIDIKQQHGNRSISSSWSHINFIFQRESLNMSIHVSVFQHACRPTCSC